MATDFQREHDVAVQAVTAAAHICRAVQAEISPETLEKKDRSPVTIADFASQAAVCRLLEQSLPDDAIVAEEDAAELRSDTANNFLAQVVSYLEKADLAADGEEVCRWIDRGNHDASGSRYWTLDPIDGTKGFLRKQQFAVSLALIIDGEIQVAALACPNLDIPGGSDDQRGVVYSAVRGQGATARPLDDPSATPQPVKVSSTPTADKARFCESVESGHSKQDASAAIAANLGISEPPVRLDSQAKYAVVARGEADIYLRLPTRADYREKIWDHAGGVLVVEEAGGQVSDIDGKPLDFKQGTELSANRGVVVTNGHLHAAVIAAIGKQGL